VTIDWTRQLRTTDGHDLAFVERIHPNAPRPISLHVPATGWCGDVDRDGRLFDGHWPVVENVPEPQS